MTVLLPATASGQTAAAPKMKIGIIGAGHIGGTIGGLWVKAGHAGLLLLTPSGGIERPRCTPWPSGPGRHRRSGDCVWRRCLHRRALRRAAADRQRLRQIIAGKIVLDANNAVASRDGAIAEEAERDGIGVTSQKYLPGTRLVRAFNTLCYMIFEREANRPAPRLAVPIAGDDQEAVQVAAGLVRDAGFDPVEVGKLADARRFQRGAPGYGQNVSAAELKQKLSLAP